MTFPEWFKEQSGLSWTVYKAAVENGSMEAPQVDPVTLKKVWDAGYKAGKGELNARKTKERSKSR